MSLGDNIKLCRIQKQLTLEQFSERTGILIEHCESIEAGRRALTSSDIRAICEVLCIDFEALVTYHVQDHSDEGSVLMPVDQLNSLLGKMQD